MKINRHNKDNIYSDDREKLSPEGPDSASFTEDDIYEFLQGSENNDNYWDTLDALSEKFGLDKAVAESYVFNYLDNMISDDEYVNEDNDFSSSEYEYVSSKSVPDSDGFYTDYTWYRRISDGLNVFVFGDNELYRPEDEDWDWETESDSVAQGWFDNYHGFADEDESDSVEMSTKIDCNDEHEYMLRKKQYEDAKREYEERGERNNNDLLSREDKMYIARGQMKEAERRLHSTLASSRIDFKMEGVYEDGFEITVTGWDEADCMSKLIDLIDKHGELAYYSGVNDEDYVDGEYVGEENFIYSDTQLQRNITVVASERNSSDIYSASEAATVDITSIVDSFREYDDELQPVTKEWLGSDIAYRTKVTTVSQANKFNYHSDYWGSADEYQERNVELMEALQPYVHKRVILDGIEGKFAGILIDKQYNSLSHTSILLDDVVKDIDSATDELEDVIQGSSDSSTTYWNSVEDYLNYNIDNGLIAWLERDSDEFDDVVWGIENSIGEVLGYSPYTIVPTNQYEDEDGVFLALESDGVRYNVSGEGNMWSTVEAACTNCKDSIQGAAEKDIYSASRLDDKIVMFKNSSDPKATPIIGLCTTSYNAGWIHNNVFYKIQDKVIDFTDLPEGQSASDIFDYLQKTVKDPIVCCILHQDSILGTLAFFATKCSSSFDIVKPLSTSVRYIFSPRHPEELLMMFNRNQKILDRRDKPAFELDIITASSSISDDDMLEWFNDCNYDVIDAGYTDDGKIIVSLNHHCPDGVEAGAEELMRCIQSAGEHVIDWTTNGDNVFIFDVISQSDYNSMQDINSATTAYGQVQSKLVSKIKSAVRAKMTSPEFGFEPDEVEEYSSVESEILDDGRIRIEVGSELSYDGMRELAEDLDKIVQAYDKDAYFDDVDAGLMEAYVDPSNKPIKSSTDVDGKINRGKVLTNCPECGAHNRVLVEFPDFKSPFADTEYTCKNCGSHNILTDPHTYDENGYITSETDANAAADEYKQGDETTFAPGSPEYNILADVADELREMSPNGHEYIVKDIYLDFGSKWMWTTIVDVDAGDGVQVLNPRQWLDLMNQKKSPQEIAQEVLDDKYCQDKPVMSATEMNFDAVSADIAEIADQYGCDAEVVQLGHGNRCWYAVEVLSEDPYSARKVYNDIKAKGYKFDNEGFLRVAENKYRIWIDGSSNSQDSVMSATGEWGDLEYEAEVDRINKSDNVYEWYSHHHPQDYQLDNIRRDATFKQVYDAYKSDEDVENVIIDLDQPHAWLDSEPVKEITYHAFELHDPKGWRGIYAAGCAEIDEDTWDNWYDQPILHDEDDWGGRYSTYGEMWEGEGYYKQPVDTATQCVINTASDSEYMNAKNSYSTYTKFRDKDKESGMIRDLIDELENKGIDYYIYDNKTDNGCVVFYDDNGEVVAYI